MRDLIVFAVALLSTTVFALPEPPIELPWYGSIIGSMLANLPAINEGLGAVMFFVMGLCRVVAEMLAFVARKTETKSDDKIVESLNMAIKWCAAVIGWFGLGSYKK